MTVWQLGVIGKVFCINFGKQVVAIKLGEKFSDNPLKPRINLSRKMLHVFANELRNL